MRILLIESRMGRRKFFGFQQDPLGSQPPHQSSFLIPATREGGCDATKYILLSYAMVNVIPFSYLLWKKMWGSPCGVQRGPLSVVRRYFCFKLPYPALSRKSPQLALPSVSLKSTLVDQLKGGRQRKELSLDVPSIMIHDPHENLNVAVFLALGSYVSGRKSLMRM